MDENRERRLLLWRLSRAMTEGGDATDRTGTRPDFLEWTALIGLIIKRLKELRGGLT